MSNYFSSDFKLGILGGGQLGKMLLTETQKFDIYTCVLDAAKDAPCANICDEFHVGSLLDFDTVYNELIFYFENKQFSDELQIQAVASDQVDYALLIKELEEESY